ncbi:hypothetical protein ABW20_dc0108702 [Dactylellina cionopaga]|nr:hypothetical protein ABW20_dc0108702 [Dactylellina cionopaga]
MPRARFRHAAGIDVELEHSDPIFLPGDTINGNILVNAASSLSGDTNRVHIKVFGRCKVLIIQNHPEGKDYWRGRAILFETSFFIDGPPVTQSDGREAWGFSVQIPTHTVPGEYKSNHPWKKASKYLDNAEMDISTHPLPGIFYYLGEGGGQRGESYVEYVLEASLRPPEDIEDDNEKQKKKKKSPPIPTTVVPLVVRTRSTDHPIQYSEWMQEVNEEVRIRTLKLLPEYANEQLGFKHNLKSDLVNREEYLDLGQLLNLHVSRTHSTRLDGERIDFKPKRPLWPSFKTGNASGGGEEDGEVDCPK